MATIPFNVGDGGQMDASPKSYPPLLVTVEKLAELLGISVRSVWRLHSAHRIPEPVRLAGSVRWRFMEIQQWVDAGCPPLENGKTRRTKPL